MTTLKHALLSMEHFFGVFETAVTVVIAAVAAWVQANIRITKTQERITALRDTHDGFEKRMVDLSSKCESDRARLWSSKADKETTAEIKADFRRSIDELKSDINHRLDAITAMLVDMQKKMM